MSSSEKELNIRIGCCSPGLLLDALRSFQQQVGVEAYDQSGVTDESGKALTVIKLFEQTRSDGTKTYRTQLEFY